LIFIQSSFAIITPFPNVANAIFKYIPLLGLSRILLIGYFIFIRF